MLTIHKKNRGNKKDDSYENQTFFPIVFPLGIKAQKLINMWKMSNLWFCFLLFKTKLVFFCAINQISPSSYAFSMRSGGPPHGSMWKKDALRRGLPPYAMWPCLLQTTVHCLLPKSSFIFFLSWHGRLLVRGDQKALLIISELRVIRVRLPSDCPVRAQIWSPGKFHGARGAAPGFSRPPPPPLTGCLAFPYLELESQSHQSLWVGLHLISRLLLEHFRNKNPCC